MNKFFIIFIILITNMMIINNSFASIENTNLKKELLKKLNQSKNFNANYKQTVYNSNKELIYSSTGKIKLSIPNHLYIENIEPQNFIMVINNKKLSIYDPNLNQVNNYNIDNYYNNNPFIYIINDKLEKIKTLQISKKNINTITTCYNVIDDSNSVDICFNYDEINTISITNSEQDTTVYSFSNIFYTIKSSKEYILNLPKNVNIINN